MSVQIRRARPKLGRVSASGSGAESGDEHGRDAPAVRGGEPPVFRVEATGGLRALILLGWASPALVLGGVAIHEMTSPVGAPPGVTAGLVGCLVWLVVLARRRRRDWLCEIGVATLTRLRFVPMLLVTLVTLVVGISDAGGGMWGSLLAVLTAMTAAAALAQRRRDRRRFRFTLVMLGVYALLVAGLDVAVGRWILPQRSHDNLFVAFDPLLGWKLKAGLSSMRETSKYVARETINSLGFRSPELPFEKPPGVKRIVFLGDSHTEAYTVDDELTYSQQVQRVLSETVPTETISLGVGGYSTDQELLAYLEYGRRFDPDIVVLQYCGNDTQYVVLDHYWRGLKPMFQRHGKMLMLTGVPVPNIRDAGFFPPGLMKVSSLAVQIESMFRNMAIKRSVTREADIDEAWVVTDLLLRDLDELVREDNAQLLVTLIDPAYEPVEPPLRELLARRAIPYLGVAHIYAENEGPFWVKGHWNEHGQTLGAVALAEQILPYLLDPTAGPH